MSGRKVGIIYTGRLGDIVGTLPRSKWWHDQGWQVLHYVTPPFASFFRSVSYVTPRVVDGDVPTAYWQSVKLANAECDVVEDRQIYPRLTHQYRASGKTWLDYYYEDKPELARVPPCFDVEYPDVGHLEKTLVVSMHGVSSPLSVDWMWVKYVANEVVRAGSVKDVVYTCHASEHAPVPWPTDCCPSYKLPAMLKTARCMFARNSGPAWMAYGVGVPTLLLPDSCFPTQDTVGPAPNLVRLPHGSDMATVKAAVEQLAQIPWNGK